MHACMNTCMQREKERENWTHAYTHASRERHQETCIEGLVSCLHTHIHTPTYTLTHTYTYVQKDRHRCASTHTNTSRNGDTDDLSPSSANNTHASKTLSLDEGLSRCAHTSTENAPASPPLSWPEVDHSEFERGKILLRTLELDSLTFSSDTLLHLTLEIFLVELNLAGRLGIPVFKFQKFIISVRSRMFDHPYHNFHHVFDVLQTTFVLGLRSGIIPTLSTMERFALAVAALCHDLEHPGISNLELLQSRRQYYSMYSSSSNLDGGTSGGSGGSVHLEKHHTRVAFQLMVVDEVDLLRGFSTSRYYAFRDCVFKLILATDMSRHGEYLERMQKFADTDPGGNSISCDKQLAMELLVKSADISNVIKPFDAAKKWAVRIADEFFAQGDMEREHGLKVTPICNRVKQTRVGLQKGFYDHVAVRFYGLIESVFPRLRGSFEYLYENRKEWDMYTDEMLLSEVAAESR
jgi:hypothetical protein